MNQSAAGTAVQCNKWDEMVMTRQMSVNCMVARMQALEPHRTTKEERDGGASESAIDQEYQFLFEVLAVKCERIIQKVAHTLPKQGKGDLIGESKTILWRCVSIFPAKEYDAGCCIHCLDVGLLKVDPQNVAHFPDEPQCVGTVVFLGYFGQAMINAAREKIRKKKKDPKTVPPDDVPDRTPPGPFEPSIKQRHSRTTKRALIESLKCSQPQPFGHLRNLLFFERWEAAQFWGGVDLRLTSFACLADFVAWREQWMSDEEQIPLFSDKVTLLAWWEEIKKCIAARTEDPKDRSEYQNVFSNSAMADLIGRLMSGECADHVTENSITMRRTHTQKDVVTRLSQCGAKPPTSDENLLFFVLRRKQRAAAQNAST